MIYMTHISDLSSFKEYLELRIKQIKQSKEKTLDDKENLYIYKKMLKIVNEDISNHHREKFNNINDGNRKRTVFRLCYSFCIIIIIIVILYFWYNK